MQPTKLVMPFKITKKGYWFLNFNSSISTCCKPREFIKLYDHHVRYYLTAIGSAFGSTALWIGAGLMSLAVLFSVYVTS
ncbi:hypothetical protein ACVNPX_01805 [Staphylococcus aureus]